MTTFSRPLTTSPVVSASGVVIETYSVSIIPSMISNPQSRPSSIRPFRNAT